MKKYPIVLKQMTDSEAKEYHLKRLERLCLESIKRDTFYAKSGYYFTPEWEDQQMIKRKLHW